MNPLDLLAWVGVIAASVVIAAVALSIVVGCIRAIRGVSKTAPVARLTRRP